MKYQTMNMVSKPHIAKSINIRSIRIYQFGIIYYHITKLCKHVRCLDATSHL